MLFACCRGLFFIFYMGLWWILFSNHHLKIITPEFISDYSKVVALSTPHPKWYFLFSGNSNTYYCTTGQSISSNYLGWWLLCFEIISWRCGEINSWWFGTTTTPIWINLLFWGGGGLTTSKTVVIALLYIDLQVRRMQPCIVHRFCLRRTASISWELASGWPIVCCPRLMMCRYDFLLFPCPYTEISCGFMMHSSSPFSYSIWCYKTLSSAVTAFQTECHCVAIKWDTDLRCETPLKCHSKIVVKHCERGSICCIILLHSCSSLIHFQLPRFEDGIAQLCLRNSDAGRLPWEAWE